MISIQKIELPFPGMALLHAEARSEGYNFVDTLLDEWDSETNRFDAPGEILCGHMDDGLIVAVGGLTYDPFGLFRPFAGHPDTGRIRRVYVRSAWRNQGIGRALVTALVEYARKNFRHVRLRAENEDAARLYERMGFSAISNPDATHILSFGETEVLE
jgi:GNAT superfamily N-acetyltransferase